MTGAVTLWVTPVLFTALLCLIFGVLRRKVPAALVISCGLFALAGYGVTGSPGQPSKPIADKTTSPPSFDPKAQSEALMFTNQFAPGARWMAMADSFAQRGDFETAAGLLKSAARQYPKDAEIWVMLGNVLAAHAQSADAPAVQLAFRNAAKINPDSPSLLYIRGVEAVQSNDLATATAAWRKLLDTGAKSAPWRADVEQLLMLTQRRQAEMQQAESAKP